eukprot:GHVN01080624.1.p2 GENE.GHVN01080624.1~~GHVN01080624.1.p2  ORF type:complete len:135 (+),score=3.25 GHVN01080624.1:410-814(+)
MELEGKNSERSGPPSGRGQEETGRDSCVPQSSQISGTGPGEFCQGTARAHRDRVRSGARMARGAAHQMRRSMDGKEDGQGRHGGGKTSGVVSLLRARGSRDLGPHGALLPALGERAVVCRSLCWMGRARSMAAR